MNTFEPEGRVLDPPGPCVRVEVRTIGRIPNLLPDDEQKLMERARPQDRDARARMILARIPLVVAVAAEYERSGLSFLDLIAEGQSGLEIAVDRFGPGFGISFGVFAAALIRQSIESALLTRGKDLPKHRRASASQRCSLLAM